MNGSITDAIKHMSMRFDEVTFAMLMAGIIAIAALIWGGPNAINIVQIAITGILALAGNRVRNE